MCYKHVDMTLYLTFEVEIFSKTQFLGMILSLCYIKSGLWHLHPQLLRRWGNTNLMSWRLPYSGWCTWWLIIGLAWCCGGGRVRDSWCECGWGGWGWGWGGALSRGGVGTGGGGCCSLLTLTGDGVGTRELGGSRGAAAAAGAGEPVGAEAGMGLGTGGVKGTSLLLCSWLRWRPETLAELQVLDSGLSFVGTPKKKGVENTRKILIFSALSDCGF